MFVVGDASPEAKRIVDVARRCRDAGIAVIHDAARLGDIGAAVEALARKEGVGGVTEVGGHRIGRHMHTEPHVAHTGRRAAGSRLKAGMAFTVEPMVNLGSAAIRQFDDGWTIVTADGSLSAQWEHTVVVTRDGCERRRYTPQAWRFVLPAKQCKEHLDPLIFARSLGTCAWS